jgi:hypothetical protein
MIFLPITLDHLVLYEAYIYPYIPYNSALSHAETPFFDAEKTTPTPVMGLLRSRKLSA